MKSSLLALLLVAVVLFVAVESHKRFRGLGRGWGKSRENQGTPSRWNNGKPVGQWNGNRRRWHGGNQGGHFRPLGWNHGKPMGPYNGNRWKWQRRNQGRPCYQRKLINPKNINSIMMYPACTRSGHFRCSLNVFLFLINFEDELLSPAWLRGVHFFVLRTSQ